MSMISVAQPRFARRNNVRTDAPTIGLLTSGGDDPVDHMVWAGAADLARERGVSLLCFPGKPLHAPHGFDAQSNVLYDLVTPESVDGLIIWLAGLMQRADLEEARDFCARYDDLPIVTTGVLVKGIPGVTVDNYHGMHQVVSHLIETHVRSRIAFICGPEFHQEAIDRYRGYVTALREHGVTLDSELVVQGNFRESGGVRAAEELLERCGTRFDALVAANDNMAIGAMKVFQAKGIRVPDAVAVAGVNDEVQGRIVTPPLTTSPLHFYEQSRQAMEMVLALLKGEPVPERVVLPTRLLIRQSCGCPDPILVQAATELPISPAPELASSASLETVFAAHRAAILTDMVQSFEGPLAGQASPWVAQLLSAFISEITGAAPDSFLAILDKGMRETVAVGEVVSRWHEVVSALRRHGLAHLREAVALRRAEHLWQQARVMIGETSQRAQAYQAWQAEQQAQILSEINQALGTVIDVTELADVLAESLPRLNIHLCYMSLYKDPLAPAETARLVLAKDRQGRRPLAAEGQPFPTRQLVPEGWAPRAPCASWVVEPLYFRTDQLGFVLFEADPRQEETYEILAGQISAALKRTLLAEHNVILYREALQARQVAEEGRRLAEEADCLKSRFLATVSHELRTPLTLIVGMIEMILAQNTESQSARTSAYSHDLQSIRTSAQHLGRLISDVLDLSSSQAGELRLACEPLDLANLLQEIILLSESVVREKGLAWRAEIPSALPTIWADRTRLKQVVLNLISNAAKFTDQGEVALAVNVEENAVIFSVSDTGMGIPEAEQETIFNEFRQSERTTQRGYGGMGLGLAVSRRLVELHGGQIGLRSSGEEGAGSTFYFTLPVMLNSTVPLTKLDDRTHSVLLLTEHAGSRDQLRTHLMQRGFQVLGLDVASTPNWLNQVISAPPGAVVLDQKPADEHGWELIKLLKQNPNTQDIPVVFYSLLEEQNRGTVLELDYLIKPASGDALTRVLRRQGVGSDGSTDGKTILVVDDDSSILDLHARLVEARVSGSRVLKARNGREALEVMAQTRPDLVLLDLMMPDMDGFAVLEAMRQRDQLRCVPVIVLTAQILTCPDMNRLQQGVAAVMSKGLLNTTEVLAQVEAVLSRNKRLGSEAQRTARQAMAYIHEHYAESITREDLARRVGLSKRHLNRCLHEEIGMSSMVYLNRYRVRQAKCLLESGTLSIVDVALAVGFSSSTYFARVFRQEVGVSPSAYQHGARPKLVQVG
jgi:signal transduction histidine kinase/DNA-binding LacI/PurR family transcriptional regulator/DNA-binding response OmpR family regulator